MYSVFYFVYTVIRRVTIGPVSNYKASVERKGKDHYHAVSWGSGQHTHLLKRYVPFTMYGTWGIHGQRYQLHIIVIVQVVICSNHEVPFICSTYLRFCSVCVYLAVRWSPTQHSLGSVTDIDTILTQWQHNVTLYLHRRNNDKTLTVMDTSSL